MVLAFEWDEEYIYVKGGQHKWLELKQGEEEDRCRRAFQHRVLTPKQAEKCLRNPNGKSLTTRNSVPGQLINQYKKKLFLDI